MKSSSQASDAAAAAVDLPAPRSIPFLHANRLARLHVGTGMDLPARLAVRTSDVGTGLAPGRQGENIMAPLQAMWGHKTEFRRYIGCDFCLGVSAGNHDGTLGGFRYFEWYV